MTTDNSRPDTGCAVCEYNCGGYCGNANPRCPNRPDSARPADQMAPPPKKAAD